MIDQSLAQPAREPSIRKERGQRLYANHAEEIRFDVGLGAWLVPSFTELTSVYEVTLGLSASCECKDFEYNGHEEPCKHIVAAKLAEAEATREDLRISWPVEEELLAACEYSLEWFEAWERHAPDGCVFGGEHAVMKKLKRAIRLAREVV